MSEAMTPRCLPIRAAAEYLGIKESLFRERVAPEIASFTIGSRRLWDRKMLDRWLDRQSGIEETAFSAKPRTALDELLNT
ncbi:hypothetical protein NKW55_04905 [Gluconobacter kondonii]|uniref:Helix-turn-helix domain-containing protein n=1 Tax=Gluconobacter cadivus TaxID=2728101 RepID=A0ABR9YU79_9PROT|nr:MULTISPECIES: hypothetical protein [Gluconobacter]MBF0888091.1 hypothetical protein [Gluconobacter cadivus]MCP1235944.1 hypothetical protein [Gluconobacter kondonii]